MKTSGLSIVIPVYNECKSLEETFRTFEEIVKSSHENIEVIFVNDGSNDGSEKLLESCKQDKFTVVNHPCNYGYGRSLKSGIKKAKYSYVAITDADGTYPDKRIIEFYKTATEKDLDMVVGARTGKDVHIPLLRKPPKWVLNKIANYLVGRKIPDLNSGLRVMRKSVVERFINILPEGFSFTTTITLAMLTNNLDVEFVSIDYKTRKGRSKIRPIYDTLNFLQLICRTVLYFRPLMIFVPLSLLLFLSGGIILLCSVLFMEKVLDTTCAIFVMTGVMMLAVGLLADMIDKRL